jgi:E3 ubiquitin-protein ligase ZNF598
MVIFTDDGEKRYEDFKETDFAKKDTNLGIAYDKQEIVEDTVLLLRYNCPDPSCDVACMGWPDLHRHVKSVHHKVMCDLCTRNKKVFTHEQDLFTQQELRKHERFGDDNPGAVDQTGFKGHPECGFCRKRFYGDDELYVHCRDRHERCHVCDRRNGGQNPRYFVDYNALEQHFGRDHFPCLDTECLEKKFVVFGSEMDLKAHQLEAHPNGLSKDARRDARRVDLSSFDYRPQFQEERRGGRRGGGRGRDPNSEPMPASSSGHMSRAEIAHQREREIQSAQSVSTRTFGGQLSQPSEPQAQVVHRPAAAQSPRPTNAQPAQPVTNPLPTSADDRPLEALTPQEQARRLRHNAVTERAANLLRNDQTKLAEFRTRISAYRNSTINASELIDAFFSLFDTSSAELGKLVKELADLFEVAGKRDALLKAWGDWKAINEDYPSLPGPSGSANTAAGILGSGIGGNRVLKLKSSTAQSSRSAQQRSWNAAASSSSKSSSAFPSLPPVNGGSAPQQASGWLALRPANAGGSNANSASNSAKASPTPSRVQSSVALNKGDAFPALPAAKKPTTTVFSPGYTGYGVVRQSNSSTPVSAWGAGGLNNGTVTPAAHVEEVEATGKGKGKKPKKQILAQWG